MIYLDHAATSLIDPVAFNAIKECPQGNPNSIHDFGLKAAKILRDSENLIKEYINGHNGDLLWLSSASLANCFVISNSFSSNSSVNQDFICTKTVHKSIKQFNYSESENSTVNVLDSGLISFNDLKSKIGSNTKLFSTLHVNNETGVIQPIHEIKDYLKNALYHVDAAQSLTKIPVDVERIKCDFLTASGHKFGLPKGIAFLWVRKNKRTPFPYLGTPQVPLVYALAETLKNKDSNENQKDIKSKKDFFTKTLNELSALNKIELTYNVQSKNTVPNILNIRFNKINASDILMELNNKKIYISANSACNSNKIEPSHVLLSMGLSREEALSSIRISISHTNTYEELEKTAIALIDTIKDTQDERSKLE